MPSFQDEFLEFQKKKEEEKKRSVPKKIGSPEAGGHSHPHRDLCVCFSSYLWVDGARHFERLQFRIKALMLKTDELSPEVLRPAHPSLVSSQISKSSGLWTEGEFSENELQFTIPIQYLRKTQILHYKPDNSEWLPPGEDQFMLETGSYRVTILLKFKTASLKENYNHIYCLERG